MGETHLLRWERGPIDREGPGVPQNGGNRPPTVEMGVMLIGRGVAYRKTDETDLCWSATDETGGRGVAYRKMGLHRILFISTVDLLQPPQAPVHPASTARYSTGYCSTTPPPSTVHPAIHTTGSCSSRGNATAHCSSTPHNAHCSSNRSASVSSSSEGIAPSGSVNIH